MVIYLQLIKFLGGGKNLPAAHENKDNLENTKKKRTD